MLKLSEEIEIFIPDGVSVEKAIERTNIMAISAHQDDIEFMAYSGIVECFNCNDKWFSGVVVTDGAGSARDGKYANYTDEQMKNIRINEQKKAAIIGEYGSMFMLKCTSKEVKNPNNIKTIQDLANIIEVARPEIIYTHNLADKHDTHVAVAIKVIKAIRLLDKIIRPQKLVGCEVWRNLDWVCDNEKVFMDASESPNLAMSLMGVFDSQISGGKRYDVATTGRRQANATYAVPTSVDSYEQLAYGIDMTPLIQDDSLNPKKYIDGYIERFKNDVENKINKLI